MSLPLIWANKINSPLLADFIAKHGAEYCMTAEEINELRDAVNEMAVIQQSVFLGVAEPAATPTGTGANYWEVITPGTYTNFGGVVLAADSRGLIYRNAAGEFSISQVAFDISGKLNVSDVIDGFASNETAKPGSANNDKLLSEKVNNTIIELRGDAFSIDGYIDPAAGAIISDPSRKRTDYIRISKEKDIIIKGENNNVYVALVAFFDENNVWISSVSNTSGTFIETTILKAAIPTNAVYIIGSTLASNASVSYIKGDLVQKIIQTVENELNIKIEALSTKENNFEKSVNGNIFDQVGYILASDGSIQTGAYVDFTSRRFTKKIRINKEYDIHVKGENNNGAVNLISFYDINEIYISGISGDGMALGTEKTILASAIPANAVYMVGSTLVSILSTSTIYSDAKIQDNLVAVQQSVNSVNNYVKSVEIGINSKRDSNKTVNLYSKKFAADASGWNLTGWSYDGTNKCIKSTSTGIGNIAQLPLVYHVDFRKMNALVEFSSDSVFAIYNHHPSNNNGCSRFLIDVVNQKIQINQSVDDASYDVVVSETVVTGFLVAGRKYIVEVLKNDLANTLKITDYLTGVDYSVTHTNTNWQSGRQNNYYGFYAKSGGECKIYEINISSKKNVLAIITGDSITEGVILPNKADRYASILRTALNGDAMISAQAGNNIDSVIAKIDTEFKYILPSYLIVTIGTNYGNTLIKLNLIKTRCDELGIKLILNHNPAEGTTNEHIAVNTQIDSIGVDGCKFDLATSISNNPIGALDGSDDRRNTSLYYDIQHPNVAGNLAMYNRFKIDVSYLFN